MHVPESAKAPDSQTDAFEKYDLIVKAAAEAQETENGLHQQLHYPSQDEIQEAKSNKHLNGRERPPHGMYWNDTSSSAGLLTLLEKHDDMHVEFTSEEKKHIIYFFKMGASLNEEIDGRSCHDLLSGYPYRLAQMQFVEHQTHQQAQQERKTLKISRLSSNIGKY